MRRYVFVILCMILISSASRSDADPSIPLVIHNQGADVPTVSVPQFARMSDKEANDVSDKLYLNIIAIHKNIFKQLQNPNLSGQQKSALYRLAGEFQVSECVDQMINDIQFVDNHSVFETAIPPFGVNGYMAQEALANIGLDAFFEIMQVMSNQRPDVPFVAANADAYAYVLFRIAGNNYSIMLLKGQMKVEASPIVRRHYELVLSCFKRHNSG